MARDGRRRRVLNEEVRTASSLSLAAYTQAAEPDAPRYGEQASVENHPQITDYVPRRKRAVIGTLLAGFGVAGGAQALRHFAEPVAASLPGLPSPVVLSSVAAGATMWTSAVVLLLCAMLAKLIYSLRRHRVDDYAGRYRVWRWVAWGALLASVNATVGIGQTIAALCMAATGKSLTASGAEWWLAPLAAVSAWIAVRLAFEIGESRSSLVFMLGAAACYATTGVVALGWSPAGAWASLIVGALPLAGHTLALAGLMIFGRYVVLDVQGLIEHKPRPAREKAPQKQAEASPAVKLAATPVSTAAAKPAAQSQRPSTSDASDEEAWDSDEDEEQGRKLSKAERKALRRQRRAA